MIIFTLTFKAILSHIENILLKALLREKNYEQKKQKIMKKYICTVCEYIYDPVEGDPDSGIEPGTAFENIPEDWVCPLCGVRKEDFEVYED